MTPAEEAAVEAAVRAVHAFEARDGQFRGTTAAEVLDERLDLDWSSFTGRGYRLLRDVLERIHGPHRRASDRGASDRRAGARFEDATAAARDRLSGAL